MAERQPTDHDLLIRLDEKFENFLKQYHVDMKNIREGVSEKLGSHSAKIAGNEKRIDELERVVGVVRLEETYNDYLEFKSEVRDIVVVSQTKANLYRVLGGVAGGIITFLLIQLPNILSSWGIFLGYLK